MTYSFTQPVCPEHWNERNPGSQVESSKLHNAGHLERCCDCNKLTCCGLYIRVDPSTVQYPTLTK